MNNYTQSRRTRKKMSLWSVAALSALLLVFVHGVMAQEKDNKTIFEEITVVNTQFPVRVYSGDRPVGGLQKSDFKLFVNGKERAINGFFEVNKKLGAPQPHTRRPAGNADAPGRLFVFIFNISDYHLKIQKDVETIFNRILQTGDRYMVISNNFFLPEAVLKDRNVEKLRFNEILEREAQRLKMQTMQMEVELKGISAEFLRRIEDAEEQKMEDYPVSIFRDYFQEYLLILTQFKQGYFAMAREQYIKVAEYLKTQDVEKWVLNFFQVGLFPQTTIHGRIQSTINAFANDHRQADRVKLEMMKFEPEIQTVDKWLVDNVSKLFINTGATVHTLLTLPRIAVPMDDYEYKPLSTDSENILREIARLTGGIVRQGLTSDKFIDDISQQPDIFYMLSFIPEENEKNNAELRVKISPEKNYRIVYDNLRKPKFFQNILDKLKEQNPPIKIEKISLEKNTLLVVVSGIKMVPLDAAQAEQIGKIDARLIVMNSESQVVWETSKSFRSRKNQSLLHTPFPDLPEGHYDVVVEIRDLLSWKSDTLGENITIGKNSAVSPGGK